MVLPPLKLSYISLERSLSDATDAMACGEPPMLDMSRTLAGYHPTGEGVEIHLAYAAVLDFYEKKSFWPRLQNDDDAKAVAELAVAINDSRRATEGAISTKCRVEEWGDDLKPRDVDEKRIQRFARLYGTELTGFCAYLGGAIAQEVIKKTGTRTSIEAQVG
jgi:hypothetical protein